MTAQLKKKSIEAANRSSLCFDISSNNFDRVIVTKPIDISIVDRYHHSQSLGYLSYYHTKISWNHQKKLSGIETKKPRECHRQITAMLSRLYIELPIFFNKQHFNSFSSVIEIFYCDESKMVAVYFVDIEGCLAAEALSIKDCSKYLFTIFRGFYHYLTLTYSSSNLGFLSFHFKKIVELNHIEIEPLSFGTEIITKCVGYTKRLSNLNIIGVYRNYLTSLIFRLSQLTGTNIHNNLTVYCLDDYESSCAMTLAANNFNLIIDNIYTPSTFQTIDLLKDNQMFDQLIALVEDHHSSSDDLLKDWISNKTDNVFLNQQIFTDSDKINISNPYLLVFPYGSFLEDRSVDRLKKFFNQQIIYDNETKKMDLRPKIVILVYAELLDHQVFNKMISDSVELLSSYDYYLAQIDTIISDKWINDHRFFNLHYCKDKNSGDNLEQSVLSTKEYYHYHLQNHNTNHRSKVDKKALFNSANNFSQKSKQSSYIMIWVKNN